MASVDNRIVRMEFDNAAFERKLETTIASLGRLEKALKFDGAKTGLSEVSAAAEKVHFGGLQSGVEGISKGFLALSTIAITALSTITSAAIDAGLAIAKAFFGPVQEGFAEYELKLGSIQTIMAGSGANLETVNAKLQELNTYSDKTIYSFKDMTQNIGKFTNAGVSLDKSVSAIQGVANVAAVSGANSEEASRAMYNFAQALSKGYVQLVDWKSIELANMGTVEFKQQLIDAAEAAGTLTKQGDRWVTSAGNAMDASKDFNDTLTDQWLTTDVLTKTLGDYADETTAIGKKATAAAQDVKTFTQLMSTVKESIGSGWAQSFEILIGNFDEAKSLWTSVNNSISSFVSKNAEARNNLLQGWKDLGGRTLLIESLGKAMKNVAEILGPIKQAFIEIFPPQTAKSLMELTTGFASFVDSMKPSAKTLNDLYHAFKGFFSVLKIGWTVITQTALFISDLFTSITGAGGGGFLTFLHKIGDFFTDLGNKLVAGGAIVDFFTKLRQIVKDIAPYIQFAKDTIVDFVKSLSSGGVDAFSGAMERAGQRFQTLKDLLSKGREMWGPFKEGLMKVMDVLEEVWGAIKRWFEELFDKIAGVMGPGDFQATLDALNVGLLGGIAALLAKFIKDGFSFDIGSGMFEKIGDSFEQLTGVLGAMQTEIKADALLKIAGAIAILTASVLVLSMIDSAALTTALAAMAVGFGQLMAAFAIISKLGTGPKSAVSFDLIATGMILLSTSILILATAVRVLSDLSWEELATGLAGVGAMLTMMTAAALILSQNSSGLISAGIGMIGIATSLAILAGVVQLFAMMSLTEMAQGFGAVAAGLLIIAGAMQLMPNGVSMALQGAGLLMISTSLAILAGVVQIFSTMSWGDMAKGMVGIAGALLIIAGAMQLMPATLPITGAGLLLVSISLIAIAKAMEMMGGLSWAEIGRGLTTMAASLLILAVATTAMSGSIPGAIAIGIVAVSLMLLAKVLQTFAGISFGDLVHGLIAMAAVLAAIGIAAMLLQPAIPAMLALGAALVLIGAGFALFGVGAALVASAFELMARVGKTGSETLVVALKNIGKAIPALATGVAEGLIEIMTILLKFAPVLIKALIEILGHLIEGLGKLIPEVIKVIAILVTSLLDYIVTVYPQFLAAGLSLIMSLLNGIKNAIGPIVTVVAEIIVNFLTALTLQLPLIIEAGVKLIIALIQGITDSIPLIAAAVVTLITTFIAEVGNSYLLIIAAGFDLLVKFLQGIADNLNKVIDAAFDVITKFIEGIANNLFRLAATATDLVVKFMDEIGNNVTKVTEAAGKLVGQLMTALSTEILKVVDKGVELVEKFLEGLGNNIVRIANAVGDFIVDVLEGLTAAINTHREEIQQGGRDLAFAIADGMSMGLASKARSLANEAGGLVTGALNKMKEIADSHSPSKETMAIAEDMGQGLVVGFRNSEYDTEQAAVSLVDVTVESFRNSLSKITESLGDTMEFNPTITPVLDLTRVSADAKKIGDYITTSQKLSPDYSFSQARTIAASANAQQDEKIKAPAGSGEVTFNQTINAPTQLTTSEIYKNTRNQITMAKQELSIP